MASTGRGGKGKKQHPKEKLFNLTLKCFTNETFPLKKIHNDMKIRELKALVEFVAGIPSHLQRLNYLDDGDMTDDTDIKYHDIVPGATLLLDIWNMWKSLVEAVAEGDPEKVFALGVTQNTTYSTPNSARMNPRQRAAWIDERAFIALCIASHRGNTNLVTKLIDAGADVTAKTPNGRTALHIAAAQGKNNCVEILLNRGAKIDDPDENGQTPLTIAAAWGHKSCERQIFLYQWQQRAAKQKPIKDDGKRMAHQIFDSKTPTWIKGDKGQMYTAQILPPDEFSGTHLSSPKRDSRPPTAPEEALQLKTLTENGEGDMQNGNEMERPARELTFQLEEGIVRPEKDPSYYSREGSAASDLSASRERKQLSKEELQKLKEEEAKREKEKSYEMWLAKKKAAEKKIREKKKQQLEAKKIKEQEEKRALNEREKSYDTWLKEQRQGKGGRAVRPQFGGQRGRSPGPMSPDDKTFDLLRLRKEMDIFNTLPTT
ncbi:ankyrin repeat domain-containing protein 35-like [Ptychodera flava]|uniref:ankyrin repeat domain-containing protein 35-like n=1 Tax=Ptychodera flava TaxID=63121 RepID=UPI00396A37E5